MLVLRGTLPTPLTGFVGRQQELRQITRWLSQPEGRLLTLVGPGGVGKTRLAIEAARQAEEQFGSEIYFLDLTRVHDPALIGDLLCEALGLPPPAGEDALSTAREALRERTALLLLDNFEHVREASSDIVRLLLDCPHVMALVTSRLPLRALGEQIMRIGPLPVPREDEQTESVELFLKRAQAADLGWEPSPEKMRDIAAVCRRLDGLPLALEIAAARVRHLSIERMLSELEAGQEFLTTTVTGGIGRTQSLADAIGWSYALLNTREQRLFRELSVFRGGFFREDAEVICTGSAIGYSLFTLSEHSLLLTEEALGKTRYRMLETIRAYAATCARESGEAGAMADRHAARYLALAQELESQLSGEGQLAALHRFALERENFLAGMRHARLKGDTTSLAAYGAALARFWMIRGPFREGAAHLTDSVEAARKLADEPLLAHLLSHLGNLLCLQGEHSRARPLFEEALALWRRIGNRTGLARALNSLGNVADVLGEVEQALDYHTESLALRRELGDELLVGASLNNLALLARRRGDLPEAERLLQEALALYERRSDSQHCAIALCNLAEVAKDRGDLARAEELYARGRALYETIGDRRGLASVAEGIAEIRAHRGEIEQARALYVESVANYEAVGDMRELAKVRARLAALDHPVAMRKPLPQKEAPPKLHSAAVGKTPRLRVRLFGAFALEPTQPGVRLPSWSRRAHRQLFQYLCLAESRPIPRAQLAEAFWPHLEPAAAQHALRKALSDIRNVLSPLQEAESLLQTNRDTVFLDTEQGIWVDARIFRTLVKEAAAHEAAGRKDAARETLQKADALYRGELLPEESEADWVFEERRRFADTHAAVLLALARHAYRAEDWQQVEALTARALSIDPCLESACRLRMSALARQGRRTEALRAFEFCRRALETELDVAPSSRTLALVQQIQSMT